jgi:uncharacterized protein DUF4242
MPKPILYSLLRKGEACAVAAILLELRSANAGDAWVAAGGKLLALIVLNYEPMPQFVIEREVPGAGKLSDSELRELSIRSLETLRGMGPQIQWLHSYVTEDKVYCVYLAPDENTIREHARRVGIPADRVSAVRRLIDPVNLQ